MNMILTFPKTNYVLADRKIIFNLSLNHTDINNKIIILSGENGTGKTTFLENIFLPILMKDNINYIYIGQDFNLQYHTIRTSLSIIHKKIIKNDLKILLKDWFNLLLDNTILMMDEFDKYFENPNEIFELTSNHISSYILVSHNPNISSYAVRNYSKKVLNFSIVDIVEKTKKVNIKMDNL